MGKLIEVSDDEFELIEENRKNRMEKTKCQKTAPWMEKAADYFMETYSGKMYINNEDVGHIRIYEITLNRTDIINAFKSNSSVIELRRQPGQHRLEFSYTIAEELKDNDFNAVDLTERCLFHITDFYNPYVSMDYYKKVASVYGMLISADEIIKNAFASKDNPIIGTRMLSDDEVHFFLNEKMEYDKALAAFKETKNLLAAKMENVMTSKMGC